MKRNKKITNVLVNVLSNSIGIDNAVLKEFIHKKICGRNFDCNKVKELKAWSNIAGAMTDLRKKGFMINSIKDGRKNQPHKYFIPKLPKESNKYAIDMSKHIITRTRTVHNTCAFVANKDYRELR